MGTAQAHGVLPLVYRSLRDAPQSEAWTGRWCAALAEMARTEAAVEAIQSAACREVLAALDAAAVAALVFKGGALAHTHYATPDLRPRDDTDLLVNEDELDTLHRVFTDLGYQKAAGTNATLVSRQHLYTQVDGRGIRHNFDVHWRISNRHRYATLLTRDELYERSVPLPGHSAAARCPCPVDATLIAALHRATHRGTHRLVWLYDIHLLLGTMSETDSEHLVRLAEEKKLLVECRDGSEGARRYLGAGGSERVHDLLAARSAATGPTDPPEIPAGVPRSIDIWLSDLKSLPDWRARLTLLTEHAFPPMHYMLDRSGTRRRWLLPWLYLERAIRGTVKLFQHH
jgi:hypothetical protein